MEQVEVNFDGLPMEGVVDIDFSPEEGCFLLHKSDGEIVKVYVENK